MGAHNQKHGITSAIDHIAGTPANPGEFNVFGTNEDGVIAELSAEVAGATSFRLGSLVRRGADGHINAPTSHANGQQYVPYNQVLSMVANGSNSGFVEGVVTQHDVMEVTDLKVGDKYINETDNHIYTVLDITAGNTGNLVVWDEGILPDSEANYFNLDDGKQWIYRPDRGEWENMGGSSHAQTHDIESSADHITRTNRTGLVYTHDKAVSILTMVDQDTGAPNVPAGSIVTSNGFGVPEFSAIKVARQFSTGPANEPMAGDAATWANGTFGFISTPSGFYLVVKVSASVIKAVELT